MSRALTTIATCLIGLGFVAALSAAPDRAFAGSYNVLYQFKGGASGDGSLPFSSVIGDSSGNFYGTTNQGGTSNQGTVFKVTATGTETVLHQFTGCQDFHDGCNPRGKLLLDKHGNLFGTTYNGGTVLGGTVFNLAPDGTESVLYSFTGQADGSLPDAGLIKDSAGNLYGTGEEGGTGGQGVVFKVDPNGNEAALYSFGGGSDGGTPTGGLLKDSAGNFYGTTEQGGVSGCGTVFKLPPGGTEAVLYTFTCGNDGAYPKSDLLRINGNLYGTTSSGGGGSCNCGTVFKVTSGGSETVLHAFAGANDGADPWSGGLFRLKRHLYGTASEGGDPQNDGVVFKLEK